MRRFAPGEKLIDQLTDADDGDGHDEGPKNAPTEAKHEYAELVFSRTFRGHCVIDHKPKADDRELEREPSEPYHDGKVTRDAALNERAA